MTNPDMAAVLRNMKVPERMTSSQALRDFLLNHLEDDEATASSAAQLKQLNGLLILSHLEVVNALGALEGAAAEKHVEKFRDEVNKKYRRRRWL
ncbi:hypothetical protein [Mycobacterium sp.]|uniref:hypothetical protein n=1 Tax=Mycobacterium sp. TaxID=1785 RepID=UPI003C72249F